MKLKPSRLVRLRDLGNGPTWDFPISDAKCWQLYRRGFADYDGRGWRLTENGKQALAMSQAPAVAGQPQE